MYPRNAASPPTIAVGAVVQISDGAVQTSGVSVVVKPEGGSETSGGGSVSYGASSGVVYYAPTQAETNYTAFVVTAYKSGCIPASVNVVTTASSTAGISIVPDNQKVDVNTIKTQTVTCSAGVTVSPYVGSTGAAVNGTNANAISTDWLDGGRLDLILDARASQSSVDTVQTTVDGLNDIAATDVWAAATRTLTSAANITSDASAITMSSSGVVGTVNLVNTTTTNTDMVTVAAIADQVWDEATSGHATAGTFGKAAADILADTNELQTNQGNWVTATGFSTHSAADVWAVATRVLTANTNLSIPTTSGIADAVWEEAIADHSGTSGSTAEALAAAGSAGDPWSTALPGAYSAGSAGYIVGTNLNATVSSRSSHSAADVRSEIDANSTEIATLVTQVGAIHGKLPSKTYLTGTSNADGDIQVDEATGNFGGSVASVVGAVGSVTGNVGGISGVTFPTNFEVLAISATTGKVTVGTNDDKTGYTLSTAGVSAVQSGLLLAADYVEPDDAATIATAVDSAITSSHGAGSYQTATGFSTFNPATDTVANVTTVGTVTNAVTLPSSATIDITGDITGNVSGSVGSVTGNVGGNVNGSVGSVLGGINTSGGTITTLDALDAAQDSQHSTTQTAISSLPSVSDILTTQMTESYASDGVAPTLAQQSL